MMAAMPPLSLLPRRTRASSCSTRCSQASASAARRRRSFSAADCEQAPLVACGRNRLTLHSRGCEVAASVDGDGVLTAPANCEIVEEGADEGSRWAGRAGTVEWLGSLGDDDYCLSNEDTYALAKAKEHGSSLGEENPERLARLGVRLGDLAEERATLVRATNRERVPGQLDAIQASLGAMPEALNARAVHIAALVNPLPALGVALEIRPAVLTARTTSRRLSMAEDGLRDSIRRLQRALAVLFEGAGGIGMVLFFYSSNSPSIPYDSAKIASSFSSAASSSPLTPSPEDARSGSELSCHGMTGLSSFSFDGPRVSSPRSSCSRTRRCVLRAFDTRIGSAGAFQAGDTATPSSRCAAPPRRGRPLPPPHAQGSAEQAGTPRRRPRRRRPACRA